MAAPNIVNVSTITGKTAVQAVSTSATAIVTNSAASGKVYKVNSVLVSNVDGANSAEVTIDLYRSSTAYHLIKTASVPAGSTLDLLAKTIYLEEGDSVRLTGSALSDLEAVCSYEEIDSTDSAVAGIFSTLTATGNTELGDAEATDTHAIKGATTLLANTSSDALRITQTGAGNALVVEDSTNPDSTPFVVDASGNVGIGISSLSTKLHVSGSSTGDVTAQVSNTGTGAARLRLTGDNGNEDFILYTATDRLGIYDGTSEIVSFKEGGNVGIGTNNPLEALDVEGDITQLANAFVASNIYFDGGFKYRGNGYAGVIKLADSAGAGIRFWVAANNTSGAGATASILEAMRITPSGNVGIGVAPSATAGLFRISPSATGGTVVNNVVANSNIKNDVTNFYGAFVSSNSTQAASFTLSAMRHFSANGVTLGSGSAITNEYGFYSDIASGTGRWNFYANGSALNYFAGNVGIGTNSPSYQIQLSTDSAGKPSTPTWTVVSDERIKEQIELADLDLCYDAVKNIPLKRFKWRDEVYSEEQVPDRHKLGWIAQDVEAVYPKAVSIHEFKYNQVYNETIIPAVEEELDEDGNVITEAQEERIEKELVSEDVIEDCRDLNADQIYAAMYGAIQKLIQKVETLEARIAELEA